MNYRTAITRKDLSAPSRYLLEKNKLIGRILDFGCGRGDLKKFLNGDIEEYDPHFVPDFPKGLFDVVVCNYVINVLDKEERAEAYGEAKSYLKKDGKLYITVRRDIKEDTLTQFCVNMDLPSLYKNGSFEVYEYEA